jgi:hypothetical protein
MPVNKEELERHIADYSKATGENIGKFVCPITEHVCEEAELINGHILNKALINASNSTVIQNGEVDHYFGRSIEPDFIRFANIRKKLPADLITEARRANITFSDGSTAEGFFGDESAAVAFPKLHITAEDGRPVENFYVRIAKDDPRLAQTRAQIEWRAKYSEAAWTGTLVKSAYLALFKKLGYRYTKIDASGQCVREALHAFYNNRGTKENASEYFYPFRNAVKVALLADGTLDTDKNVPDTLAADTFFFHFRSKDDVPFGVSLRFKINDLITTVTLPAPCGTDANSIKTYDQLMDNKNDVDQYIRWAVFKNGEWNMNSSKHQIRYQA